MAPENNASVGRGSPDPAHVQPRSPDPAESLARRLSRWTTNGLLTGILIVAALGFGRQVLTWWRVDSPNPGRSVVPAGLDDGMGDPRQVHVLDFGDQHWSIRRQEVTGRTDRAANALRQACREQIAAAHAPTDRPDANELRLLKTLGHQKPVAEAPGQWQIYSIDQGIPMVAGVRPTRGATPSGSGAQLAETIPRVVIWGVAVPIGPESWAIYLFEPAAGVGRSLETAVQAAIPLPPDARRLLSVRAAGGGAVVAFTGPGRPEAYKQFYDRWFGERGWTSTSGGAAVGSAWAQRYVAPSDVAPTAVDVRLGLDRRGQCTGMVMTSAGRQPAEISTQDRGHP